MTIPPQTPAADPAMLAELKHTISLGPDAAANAAQRLHRMVEAVLKLHRPGCVIEEHGELYQICVECCAQSEPEEDGDLTSECLAVHEHAPGKPICATVAAITRELLGKET